MFNLKNGISGLKKRMLGLKNCMIKTNNSIFGFGQYKMQTADCRLQTGYKMQTRYKMQTADCRLGIKCRLRPKPPLRQIQSYTIVFRDHFP